MVINEVALLRKKDIANYAWARIALFQNIEHTTSVIERLHHLPLKQHSNAKQQAEQIKYCLIQAKEYFDAAQSVTLATRPVLLYYSVMSMALAEILLKQTADSRLAKLRAQHNCHGLQLTISSDPKPEDSLSVATSKLIAKAQVDGHGNPRGTFEIWRRSAREYPVGAYSEQRFSNGTSTKSFLRLMTASDLPPPILGAKGISLHTCLSELPYMQELLFSLGSRATVVRATLHHAHDDAGNHTRTLIVHPTDNDLIEQFGAMIKVDPAAVNTLGISELPSGYIVTESIRHDERPGMRHFPHSICISDEDIYFSCSNINLGEFGFMYVALHICGNFARYYPDLWLKHIEKSSHTAMAVDELCKHAVVRLPLLCLSELTRKYYVEGK